MERNMNYCIISLLVFVSLFSWNLIDAATTLNSTSPIIWKFENCSFENLDKCAQIVMLFGARSLILPNNTIDMVPHCEEEKSAVKCVSEWGKKCLKSFSRHLLKIALAGGGRNIKERCASKGTDWYLRNFKCVNDSLPACHDCMDIVKNEVNLIRFNGEKKEWIATGCCYLDKFKNCFKTAIDGFCDDDGKSFLNWCVNSYFTDVVELACTKDLVWGEDKCNNLISHIEVPGNYSDPEPHSLFVPLYKLLLEFGDMDITGISNSPFATNIDP